MTPSEPHTTTIERDVEVPMSDGVRLAGDVFVPGPSPCPAILVRTPYDRDLSLPAPDLAAYTRAGYAVVIQNVRGRYGSGGGFQPFRQEADDGKDTIDWIAAQPWCSGDVFMVGESYYGATQWLAASRAPTALRGLSPGATSASYHDGWCYQGGALQLGFVLLWTTAVLALADVPRYLQTPGARPELFGELVAAVDGIDDLYGHRPLADIDVLREVAPYYREWLDHPSYDTYWKATAPQESYRAIGCPTLNVGGWYDLFLGGTLRNYLGMKRHGGNEAARQPRLVIGPWAHAATSGDFAEQRFGLMGNAQSAQIPQRQIAFFDAIAAGRTPDDPPVSLFVMGRNEWRTADDWPLPDTIFTKYYLHSSGHAASTLGDGTLDIIAPASEPEDVFVYDPRDPVPTVGGQTFLPGFLVAANAGPRDQREVERRADVLCFTTPVLEHDVTVIGPVELVLFVTSSARDTDFTGKLIDVHPDGRAVILTDGIMRARYRESLEQPVALEPGETSRLTVDLVATANVFTAGHRIRLEISSSNFPKFDRNTNTGRRIAEERDADAVSATNRVFHDRERPSHLVLPVVGD